MDKKLEKFAKKNKKDKNEIRRYKKWRKYSPPLSIIVGISSLFLIIFCSSPLFNKYMPWSLLPVIIYSIPLIAAISIGLGLKKSDINFQNLQLYEIKSAIRKFEENSNRAFEHLKNYRKLVTKSQPEKNIFVFDSEIEHLLLKYISRLENAKDIESALKKSFPKIMKEIITHNKTSGTEKISSEIEKIETQESGSKLDIFFPLVQYLEDVKKIWWSYSALLIICISLYFILNYEIASLIGLIGLAALNLYSRS